MINASYINFAYVKNLFSCLSLTAEIVSKCIIRSLCQHPDKQKPLLRRNIFNQFTIYLFICFKYMYIEECKCIMWPIKIRNLDLRKLLR